jgi:hypothetical protein
MPEEVTSPDEAEVQAADGPKMVRRLAKKVFDRLAGASTRPIAPGQIILMSAAQAKDTDAAGITVDPDKPEPKAIAKPDAKKD